MKKIGVLGGGQLGMMLFESSAGLPVELFFLDPNPSCSCASVTPNVTTGDFKDFDEVLSFGSDKDIITVEIEHVNTEALKVLQDQGKEVYPQPEILQLIQDKGLQKDFYRTAGFPTAPYELLDSSDLVDMEKWAIPFVLKSRTGGYDGKGVDIIRERSQLQQSIAGPVVVETLADLQLELSVIVARNSDGEKRAFPVVEMKFDPVANLVELLLSPARIPAEVAKSAQNIAEEIIERLGLVGILAVEFFWLEDGSLWVNEVAPRPHNSGHQTIEGNRTSQYEQHIRAIAGLPLGDTEAMGTAVMVNLLGAEGHKGPSSLRGAEILKGHPNAFLHDYLKKQTRPMRKMGHITVVDEDPEQALSLARRLQGHVSFVSAQSMNEHQN